MATAAASEWGQTYSAIDVVGLSGASGITTLCKSMPQCSMYLFSKDLARCFLVTPDGQNQELASRVALNADTDALCNVMVFAVSAKPNELDASMKAIGKYLQVRSGASGASGAAFAFVDEKVVVAVNKMDAVGYSEERFRGIKQQMEQMLRQQGGIEAEKILGVIPVSATKGDNMREASAKMKWFRGPSLSGIIEKATPKSSSGSRRHHVLGSTVCRAVAGSTLCLEQVEKDTLQVGEPVKFFPAGIESTVDSIRSYETIIDVEHAGQCIAFKVGATNEWSCRIL